jgi:hypothetical protein
MTAAPVPHGHRDLAGFDLAGFMNRARRGRLGVPRPLL